jgi:hypothetical protein
MTKLQEIPTSDVFEGIISRFQMGYTPYEQLVVFRGKCPFRMFIKSKPGQYGIKLWVADDANTFYACNMKVYTGKNNGVREKEQGFRVVRDMVCHQYGSGRGVITDNFFTSYELANFLLTKTMTLIGKLRKNKPEIPALFLNGKPRHVHSFLFAFTNDLTLVPYETRFSSSFYQGMMMTRTWEKEKIRNLKSSYK